MKRIYEKLGSEIGQLAINASVLAGSVYLGMCGEKAGSMATELYGVVDSVEPLRDKYNVPPYASVTGLVAVKNFAQYIMSGNEANLQVALGSMGAGVLLGAKDLVQRTIKKRRHNLEEKLERD